MLLEVGSTLIIRLLRFLPYHTRARDLSSKEKVIVVLTLSHVFIDIQENIIT